MREIELAQLIHNLQYKHNSVLFFGSPNQINRIKHKTD